jgi:hypothetical protein
MPPRRPQPTAKDAVIALARRVRRAEAETVEDWEERAAVREIDGGQMRHAAEAGALEDLRRLHEPQRRMM